MLVERPIKRLFTMGCSFTKYFWPCWSEIVDLQLNPQEFYNFGDPGAGNSYINHTVQLNNLKYNFGPDDMIMICWSNILRNDWFIDYEWSAEGNMLFGGKYNSLLPDKLKLPEHCLARDLVNMVGTIQLLDQIGCQHHHFSMNTMFATDDHRTYEVFHETIIQSDYIRPLIDYCSPYLNKSFYDVLEDSVRENWLNHFPEDEFNGNEWDQHPMPLHHLNYLQSVFPDTQFNNNVVLACEKAEQRAVDILIDTPRNTEYFKTYFELYDPIKLRDFV